MLLLNNCSKTVSGHFFAICIFIFHKTEAHTVILRCTMGLNLNWFKSYGLRCSKMQSFPFLIFNDFVKKPQMSVFVQNRKIMEMEIFAFCVIIFLPIRIQIHYSCQNDRLNLSFVKDTCTGGKKVDRNGCKMALYESVLFRIRLQVSILAVIF